MVVSGDGCSQQRRWSWRGSRVRELRMVAIEDCWILQPSNLTQEEKLHRKKKEEERERENYRMLNAFLFGSLQNKENNAILIWLTSIGTWTDPKHKSMEKGKSQHMNMCWSCMQCHTKQKGTKPKKTKKVRNTLLYSDYFQQG